MDTPRTDSRPAWREPMVWLLCALPLAAVVAGIAMVFVAGGAGSTDAVAEPVRRTAQVQVADLGPDAQAARLGLRAVVRHAATFVEVLPAGGTFDRDRPLRLALRHPTRAALDRDLTLAPTALGWRAQVAFDVGHAWNLELAAPDGRWRLYGRLPAGQHAALVRPALGDDP